MPTFCDILFSACRKLIFIFFYASAKNFLISLMKKKKNAKKLNIFINFGKIAISRPQIEGLCVNFPRFSDFRGQICRFWGKKFAIFCKKLTSRDSKFSEFNQQIFMKNGHKITKKIFKKIPEI
jgi:hypothetical protein